MPRSFALSAARNADCMAAYGPPSSRSFFTTMPPLPTAIVSAPERSVIVMMVSFLDDNMCATPHFASAGIGGLVDWWRLAPSLRPKLRPGLDGADSSRGFEGGWLESLEPIKIIYYLLQFFSFRIVMMLGQFGAKVKLPLGLHGKAPPLLDLLSIKPSHYLPQ